MIKYSSEKIISRIELANDLKQQSNKEVVLSRNLNKRETNIVFNRTSKQLPSIFKTNSIPFVERVMIKKGTLQFNNNPMQHSVFSSNAYDFAYNIHSNSNANNNSIRNSIRNSINIGLFLNSKTQTKDRDCNPNKKLNKDLSLKQLMSINIKNLLPYDIKYSNDLKSSLNNQIKARNFSSTTTPPTSFNQKGVSKFKTMKVSIKKPNKSEQFLKKLLSLNTNSTKNLQILLKLKCIKWLWKYKSIIIEKLIFSYNHFKWFFNKYENIEQKRFTEFLVLLKVSKDEEFCEKLYLIYGQNKSKTMNIKECLFMFILTSNFPYDNKLILLIDVANDDNSKSVQLTKLLKYFSLILPVQDYYDCLNAIKRIIKIDEIDKEELVSKLVALKPLKMILKNYYSFFVNIDNKMKEELTAKFNVSLKYFM